MAVKRKAISKGRRFEIFKRDGFTCQYCGAHPPGTILHVDHIVAVANGGGSDDDNLVTSCLTCNLGKSATPLEVVPESLKDRAARVVEQEEQIRGYQSVMEARRERLELETWRVLEVMYGPKIESAKRDQFSSVKMFIERLGFDSVLDAAEIAMGAPISYRQTFPYFCGVCWNRIKGRAQ